ncbi:MAG: pyridoxal 5'-phosphate synthase glutaminase subunit PdxT [Halanaerobiales bacterium]
MAGRKKKIGVLALQGAFAEHIETLKKLFCHVITIKKAEQLDLLDGLIIPGGESTTIRRLMQEYDFIDNIRKYANSGMGIMGTCAGLILLANEISGEDNNCPGLIDIEVKRNAYGRQINSFEDQLDVKYIGRKKFPAIFIRAPRINRVGRQVDILARYNDDAVLVRQNKILVSTFHPELTDDTRIHQYFLDML